MMQRMVLLSLVLLLATSASIDGRLREPNTSRCDNCYDISGTWLFGEPEIAHTIFELVQSGTTVTGTTTRVFPPGNEPYACTVLEWPVTGTIDPDTGEFSLTETNPNLEETNPCQAAWTVYEGSFATSTSLTANVAQYIPITDYPPYFDGMHYTEIQATLQEQTPTLVVSSSSVVRGQSATFTVQNLGTGTVIGWRFAAAIGQVTRTASVSSATWSGPIVSAGTAHVTVRRNGVDREIPRAIAVTARNKTFSAVSPTKVANGFNEVLTVPAVPPPNGGVWQVPIQYPL
jgi:hypothetical protein